MRFSGFGIGAKAVSGSPTSTKQAACAFTVQCSFSSYRKSFPVVLVVPCMHHGTRGGIERSPTADCCGHLQVVASFEHSPKCTRQGSST